MAKFINLKSTEYEKKSQTTTPPCSLVPTYNHIKVTPSTDSRKFMSNLADSAWKRPVNYWHSLKPIQAELTDENAFMPPIPQTVDLDTFKGFKFIMLDCLIKETREIYDKISGTYLWEICENNLDRCANFVRNECVNKRIFLITPGSLGQKLVPLIHFLPQVYCIYIYCADVEFHCEWTHKYSKVRVVCNDDDKYLLPQFAIDVAQANIDWGNALLNVGTRDKAKQKFQKALDNVTTYVLNPLSTMVYQIERKLHECG